MKAGFHFKFSIAHWMPQWDLLAPWFAGGKMFLLSLWRGVYWKHSLFSLRDGWGDAFGEGVGTCSLSNASVNFQMMRSAGPSHQSTWRKRCSGVWPLPGANETTEDGSTNETRSWAAAPAMNKHWEDGGWWQAPMTLLFVPLQALLPLKSFVTSMMPRDLSAGLKGNLSSVHTEPHGDGHL